MPSPRFTLSRQQLRWAFLLALSFVLTYGFEHAGLPAGPLLGPMLAAIVLSVSGADVKVPRAGFIASQGVIGLLIARGIPASIFSELSQHWLVFLLGVVSVTLLANGLGWTLSRWKVLPGTTAVWGMTPGGASAMVIMAEAYGADERLVAFMQYLRVACVSFAAAAVAHWWMRDNAAAVHAAAPSLLQPPGSWAGLAATAIIAFGGAALGVRLRLPARGLLLPMVLGVAMQDAAHVPIELPPLLLAAAYAIVGWTIGTRFNRQVLAVTIRSLPIVLAAIVALILLCGGLAAALVHWAHVDPLTAYLATSPGGADSVAIIAASSPVDMPFVLSMQVLRMLFVMATGPAIARMMARRLAKREA